MQGRIVSFFSVVQSSSSSTTQIFSPSLNRSKYMYVRPSSSMNSVLSMHFSSAIIGCRVSCTKGPSGESEVATQMCSSAVKYM